MNFILLALLIVTVTPSFEAQTLDGKSFIGTMAELTPERLAIDAADGRVSIDTDELVSVSSRNMPQHSRNASGVIVTLIDGSRIVAREYTTEGRQAKITLSTGEVLDTPINTIQTVQLHQDSEPQDAEWLQLIDRKIDGDLLVVQNSQGIDYHQGVLHDVTDDAVWFDLDGERLLVKRSKVFGFVYRHGQETELPGTICRITDSAGSLWSVGSLHLAVKLPSPDQPSVGARRGAGGEGGDEADNQQTNHASDRPHPNPLPKGEGTTDVLISKGEGTIQWTTPTGIQIKQPTRNIVQIDFSGGKILYLSDMKPEGIRWTPYFDVGKTPAAVEQFYAPRYDRGFESGPLQLGGVQYRKGLALHSRTEIAYRLPDRFRRFRAIAGIADMARPGGNVRLIVQGDGRVLFDALIAGNAAPRPVDLDLTDVRRLTIMVDFGNSINMGDYLLLCNARLSK